MSFGQLPRLIADETTAPVFSLGWVGSTGHCLCLRPTAKLSGRSPTSRASREFCRSIAGYRNLADRGDIRLAFCWSHVRPGFYELATPGPAPIATRLLRVQGRRLRLMC
jgi:hypothetical protein